MCRATLVPLVLLSDPVCPRVLCFRSRVQGKLQGLSKLKKLADGQVDGVHIRAEAETVLRDARLMHLRLAMKVADLRLLTIRHDKAQASLHAASGALICLKRLELQKRKGAALSAGELRAATRDQQRSVSRTAVLNRTARSGEGGDDADAAAFADDVAIELGDAASVRPSGPFGDDGKLSFEMRSFVRGCFGPMLKAAMAQLLRTMPPEPFTFLAEWFWQHSSLNRYDENGTVLTQRDVDERRRGVAAAHNELARLTRSIAGLLDEAEQARGASEMLLRLLDGLPQRQISFNSLSQIDAQLPPESAWTSEHANPQTRFANHQLLDGVAAVLSFHPRTMLQVHVTPPEGVRRLPPHLLEALRLPDATPPADAVRLGCARLARRRAEAVTAALVMRGVAPQRLVATAPGFDLGLQAAGQLTLHALPEALRLAADEASGGGVEGDGASGASKDDGAYVEEGPLAPAEEALVALRRRRETQLEATRIEFAELQAYVGGYPQMMLPRPLTLVVSVVDVSLPSADAHAIIALGAERIVGRVAAFELVDTGVEEVDIELWTGADADVGGPLERIVGVCVVGVAELLVPGGLPAISASLPVSTPGGVVVGSVRVTVEVRLPDASHPYA